MDKKDLKCIVHQYDAETHERQLMEECGELIQAVNKYWRFKNDMIDGEEDDYVNNIVEEIADVQICIEYMLIRLREKYNVDAMLDMIKNNKITRELIRIANYDNRKEKNNDIAALDDSIEEYAEYKIKNLLDGICDNLKDIRNELSFLIEEDNHE